MLAPHAIHQILGDCSDLYRWQTQCLLHLGIDVGGLAVSHLAFRTETLVEYLALRQQLQPFDGFDQVLE